MNYNIIKLETVDSTNNYAKQLAKNGAESGTVIVADEQTAGRGQFDRRFHSPKAQGLYMSVILRPQSLVSDIQSLTTAVGCSVIRAIRSIYGELDLQIKGVNDVMLGGKKLCGILTESSVSSDGTVEWIVIGIGINTGCTDDFPPELHGIATPLSEHTGMTINRMQLCKSVLIELLTV